MAFWFTLNIIITVLNKQAVAFNVINIPAPNYRLSILLCNENLDTVLMLLASSAVSTGYHSQPFSPWYTDSTHFWSGLLGHSQVNTTDKQNSILNSTLYYTCLTLLQSDSIHLYVHIFPIHFFSLGFSGKLQLFVCISIPWASIQVRFLFLVPFPQDEEHYIILCKRNYGVC